jgi:poly [ADP-ribose] polymerase
MAVTKEIKLVYADIVDNHNKVWIGELHDNGDVITKWGRIRADVMENLQSKTFSGAGESFLLKKEREKLNKGYTAAKVVSGSTGAGDTAKSVAANNLQQIAREQLAKNHPELGKLIDRLVKANIHNITSQTNITFNAATGLFQTPLGVVTPEGVTEARDLLVEIKKALIDRKNSALLKLVSNYLRIVPQDVGMKFRVESVFPDVDAVQKQADILDSLEASYKAMIATPVKAGDTKTKVEQVFAADLDVLTDPRETRRLEDFYHKSMKSMHGYGHVKIRQMFTVDVQEMSKSYDSKLGNDTEVYHGTSQANLLSILKSGLKTSPPSSAYIAGKMFGNGIYGAINSSKSLGYTFGRWGGGGGDSGWLFVCDFAMGKIHEPTSTLNHPPSGHDSVWAKAHKVRLNHDELIVYRNNQVRIKYLLECK